MPSPGTFSPALPYQVWDSPRKNRCYKILSIIPLPYTTMGGNVRTVWCSYLDSNDHYIRGHSGIAHVVSIKTCLGLQSRCWTKLVQIRVRYMFLYGSAVQKVSRVPPGEPPTSRANNRRRISISPQKNSTYSAPIDPFHLIVVYGPTCYLCYVESDSWQQFW